MSLDLGLMLGYWGAQPPTDLIPVAEEAERLGDRSIWRDRLQAWREAPVTTPLVANQDAATIRTMAELVLS